MDARGKTYLGLLVVSCLLLSSLTSSRAQQPRPKGGLYVIPRVSRCSETLLPLELDGIGPLPTQVILKIRRSGENQDLVKQQLKLDGDKYKWSGLLAPLGKYDALLFALNDESTPLGIFTFNNIDILKDFIKEERGEITYINRGGPGSVDPSIEESIRKPLPVERLPKRDGRNQLHIIVMNGRGTEADEYFGPPPESQRWVSKPLRLGEYRLIVVEYKGDGSCQLIRGK